MMRFKDVPEDTRKDIQSWKFVKLSNESARMNNFKDIEDFKAYVTKYAGNMTIDYDEIRIPIHVKMNRNDDELETYYYNVESCLFHPVLFLPHLEEPDDIEITNVLAFLLIMIPDCDALEIFEVLSDHQLR